MDRDRILEGSGGVTVGETMFTHGITPEEITRAGEAVLMAIGTCAALGHVSPNGLMDYVNRDDLDPIAALVWDAFASTRGNKEASANLVRFAGQRGLLELVAEAATH